LLCNSAVIPWKTTDKLLPWVFEATRERHQNAAVGLQFFSAFLPVLPFWPLVSAPIPAI
jgi:hypothetical protein